MNLIKNIQIPIAPINEQKRVIATIENVFEQIEQARITAEKNLQNTRDLFKSYLTEIYSTKNNKWEEKKLEDVCSKIQDGAHHSPKNTYPEKKKDRFVYITSKNIRNNYMDLSNINYVCSEFHNTIYPRCNPELGDILLTKDGVNTGNVTLNTLNEPFSLLSSVCLIKTNSSKLIPSFLKYYIQSKHGFEQITGKMTGAAIKRIILKTIKSATIPLPEINEQILYVKKFDRLLTEVKLLENIYQQKLHCLEELKKSILQKAFSGELH